MKLCDISIQQLEQQEEILKQLQQELNKERSRHQETSSQLHHNKKTLTTLNDDFDALQKREREAQASVSALCDCFFNYVLDWTVRHQFIQICYNSKTVGFPNIALNARYFEVIKVKIYVLTFLLSFC